MSESYEILVHQPTCALCLLTTADQPVRCTCTPRRRLPLISDEEAALLWPDNPWDERPATEY